LKGLQENVDVEYLEVVFLTRGFIGF